MDEQHETGPGSRQERIREELNETGRNAREAVDELREEAVAQGQKAMHEARRQAGAYADARRAAAAENITDVADALHASAQTLDERGKHGLADYSNSAAAGAERLAEWVRDKSWTEVWHEAEGYARRQPLVTFGGALAAGFVLARFLKSSAEGAYEKSSAEGAYGRPRPHGTATGTEPHIPGTGTATDPRMAEIQVPDPNVTGPGVGRPPV